MLKKKEEKKDDKKKEDPKKDEKPSAAKVGYDSNSNNDFHRILHYLLHSYFL
jgi:hypothetical protein